MGTSHSTPHNWFFQLQLISAKASYNLPLEPTNSTKRYWPTLKVSSNSESDPVNEKLLVKLFNLSWSEELYSEFSFTTPTTAGRITRSCSLYPVYTRVSTTQRQHITRWNLTNQNSKATNINDSDNGGHHLGKIDTSQGWYFSVTHLMRIENSSFWPHMSTCGVPQI